MPTLRKPRSMGQPISWWCMRGKPGPVQQRQSPVTISHTASALLDSYLMRQQAKDVDSSFRAHVDFSIGDRGSNELVALAKVIAAIRSLVAVVQLMQGQGIVGMQHRRIEILGRPNDGGSAVTG